MADLANHHDSDGIGSALRATSEWAGSQAPLEEVSAVRSAGRRRQHRRWAGFGSAAALALVTVSLVTTSLVDGGSAVTVPADSPSGSASVVPVVVPFPGAFVPIPPDLTLTGDVRRHAEAVVTTVDRLDAELCSGQVLAGSSPAATTFEKVLRPTRVDQRGLLVFDGPAGAEMLMASLRSQAQSCTAPMALPDGATRRVLTEPISGAWDDGVAMLRIDDGETASSLYPPTGSWLLAARRGSAVLVRFDQGEYYLDEVPTAIDGDFLAEERAALDAIAPELCRWAAAPSTAPCP